MLARLNISSLLTLNKLAFVRNAGQFQRSFQLTNSNINNELRDKIKKLARKNDIPTDGEFEVLRTDLISNSKSITEINVDYFIVSTFNEASNLYFVENYINFLKKNELKVNNSTFGRLMKLYNLAYQVGILTLEGQNIIINIYEEILKSHDALDATTSENLILGLICTKQWKKSLELLDIIKLSSKPSNNVYSSIISKAFKTDADHKLAWNLLLEMVIEHKKQPKCEVLISYFEWIFVQKDKKKQFESLHMMLTFIGEHDIVISKLVVKELKKLLECIEVNCYETEILFNGKCKNCNLFLERIFISSNDFKKMRNAFLEKVLVRKDVFIKTNPEELDNFLKLVDKHAPFHCVVDGLNVAYSKGGKQASDIVCSVVKYFKDLNMNILLLGRKHMSRWPKEHLLFIKKNSKIFFTDDLSQDDPFLLYAALKSGPSTHIFSRDLMRSHSYLLGGDLKIIFKKWLQEHLYSLATVKGDGKITVKEPNKYNINAHMVQDTWHIPFRDDYQSNPKDSYEVPKNWLCMPNFTASKIQHNFTASQLQKVI